MEQWSIYQVLPWGVWFLFKIPQIDFFSSIKLPFNLVIADHKDNNFVCIKSYK